MLYPTLHDRISRIGGLEVRGGPVKNSKSCSLDNQVIVIGRDTKLAGIIVQFHLTPVF